MNQPLPPATLLNEYYNIDIETGILTHKRKSRGIKCGSVAGSVHTQGYIQVKVDGVRFLAHRIIWMMVYGEDPGELMVEHRDRDESNNRLSNLRLANDPQNIANREGFGKYRKGVVLKNNKWIARISYQKEIIYLGSYLTEDEAGDAYDAKSRELYGEFSTSCLSSTGAHL